MVFVGGVGLDVPPKLPPSYFVAAGATTAGPVWRLYTFWMNCEVADCTAAGSVMPLLMSICWMEEEPIASATANFWLSVSGAPPEACTCWSAMIAVLIPVRAMLYSGPEGESASKGSASSAPSSAMGAAFLMNGTNLSMKRSKALSFLAGAAGAALSGCDPAVFHPAYGLA